MAERRAAGKNEGAPARDLFDLMGDARDPETGAAFTDEQLGDQVATMILAGHETTATALFWALYLLALDPATQEEVAAEVQAADVIAQQRGPEGFGGLVIGSILLGAVVFAAAGLYALMSVAVARRTREIGIRIALGANPRRVLRTVFARAGRQLGGGIIAGNSLIMLLAWRADSLTADLLVSSVITSVIMAVVGVLACAAPARRALRVQPTEALRQV